jgi:hypothetical protein
MDSYLSSKVKVSEYRSFVKNREPDKIIAFLKQRFTERYVEPMRVEKDKKNGFTIMAISCLMIESLESFYQGWEDSNSKSQLAFRNFFDRNDNFAFIRGYSQEFYKCVRCGILHQGETGKGWHIRRDGVVFQEQSKTINAKLFHDQVEVALNKYCEKLKSEDWNSEIWKKLRKKMNAVCKNCEA